MTCDLWCVCCYESKLKNTDLQETSITQRTYTNG